MPPSSISFLIIILSVTAAILNIFDAFRSWIRHVIGPPRDKISMCVFFYRHKYLRRTNIFAIGCLSNTYVRDRGKNGKLEIQLQLRTLNGAEYRSMCDVRVFFSLFDYSNVHQRADENV